jgi:hypothetical protein
MGFRQARVGKYIAPEEEWMRLLTAELEPVMEHLQGADLPPGTHACRCAPRVHLDLAPMGRSFVACSCAEHGGLCARCTGVCRHAREVECHQME